MIAAALLRIDSALCRALGLAARLSRVARRQRPALVVIAAIVMVATFLAGSARASIASGCLFMAVLLPFTLAPIGADQPKKGGAR